MDTFQDIEHINTTDIVVAFMGPTGAGKSHFIDLLTGVAGSDERRSGDSLQSVTAEVRGYRVNGHEKYGNRLVLVDTPGFDDTTRSDMQVLENISDWLQSTYKREIKLAGLLYLHRITDNRMGGSPLKNLRMFGELCGEVAMSQVILVTTMWDKVSLSIGEAREKDLCDTFWKPMLDKNSRSDRLQGNSKDDAWRIINTLVEYVSKKEAILLQEELVDLRKRLNETQAGKALFTNLQQHLHDMRAQLKDLIEKTKNQDNGQLNKILEEEYRRLDREFQETFKVVEKLKIPIGRRIALFFSGRKASTKAVRIDA